MTDLLDGPATLGPDDVLPGDICPECLTEGRTWQPRADIDDPQKRAAALGAHRWQKHKVKGTARDRERDKAPPSVRIDLGGPKGKAKGSDEAVLAAVEERARQLAGAIAVVLLLANQPEDSADIERGRDAWAQTVRDLAVHEKWLRGLAAGGETSERAIAWLKFLVATGALVTPILVRHDAIPEAISRLLVMAEAPPGVPPPPPTTSVPGEPVAA